MNRRKFLFSTAITAAGLAALPKAVRAGKYEGEKPYTYSSDTGLKEPDTYEITIYHTAVTELAKATADQKIVTLSISHWKNYMVDKTDKVKYIIKKSAKAVEGSSLWDVEAELDKASASNVDLPKDIKKTIKLRVQTYDHAEILGKKDKLISSMKYVSPPSTSSGSSGGGCFITTACVTSRGLADDCAELTALRFVRDTHMVNNNEGRSLVAAYQTLGPEIVNAVDGCTNSKEIYDYMFDNMIAPAVEMVNAGELDEAVSHYKLWVSALQEAYC